MYTFSPGNFYVWLFVQLYAMPLNIYKIVQRQTGTARVDAWRVRAQTVADLVLRGYRVNWGVLALWITLAVLAWYSGGTALAMGAAVKTPPAIEYYGKAITLPDDPKKMDLGTAITWLEKIKADEETRVRVWETIDVYPWDGNRALMLAIAKTYGFAQQTATPGFFGDTPPTMVTIKVDVDRSESIAFGRMQLPQISGYIETSQTTNTHGQLIFALGGQVLKKDVPRIAELVQLTRDLLKTESIYQGKAIKFAWDDNEEQAKVPDFIDLSRVRPDELIFSPDVDDQVTTTIFTPLRRRDWCKELCIPFKRGVCLMGMYGTGKTQAIYVAAKYAIEQGITTVLVEDATHLVDAMAFARQYSPALVVCEDIDRVTESRDSTCNEIMDALDGVEAKGTDVMVLFTTNNADSIHPAMRRPGRIDTFIKVTAPDAIAVQRLLRLYGRKQIPGDEDLGEVADMLAGQIPAVIREVVERAKLAAVARAEQPRDARTLTSHDLKVSAARMLMQIELFAPKSDNDLSAAVAAGSLLAAQFSTLTSKALIGHATTVKALGVRN
jgi:transitional endoplasmic reticulum ATPase